MRSFEEIYAISADRKGGADALEALLATAQPHSAPATIEDSAWLRAMAKSIFRAGFSWKVIEAKWPGFEAAFQGFAPSQVAFYSDADLDRLLADTAIVRNGSKLQAVIDNAIFLNALATEHGSASGFFAAWPLEDQHGLLEYLKKNGSRLGGATGQRVLREVGIDGYVLSPDVVARLIAEGVVDKQPTSKRDMAAVQSAFNTWSKQSGRSVTAISRTLAFSV